MKDNQSEKPEKGNEPKYLNLLTDFGFKKMFGEQNKKFLIALINSILSDSVGVIEDVTYMNTEQLGERPTEKKMVYDIYCTTADRRHIIVELQVGGQPYFGDRAFTYVSRLVSKEAPKGERKYEVPAIYSINILDFRMTVFNDPDTYLWEIQLKDQRNEVFLPQIKFIFIELCTFARLFKKAEYRKSLHRWLYIIKNMGKETTRECPFDEPIYRDFFEQGKVNKLSIMEKEDYAKSILEYQEVQDTIEYEREYARNEGRAEGLAKGRAEGKAEGLAEGKAEGLAEGEAKGKAEAKLAMAKNMLEKKIDIETIISITGLTAEEIMSN